MEIWVCYPSEPLILKDFKEVTELRIVLFLGTTSLFLSANVRLYWQGNAIKPMTMNSPLECSGFSRWPLRIHWDHLQFCILFQSSTEQNQINNFEFRYWNALEVVLILNPDLHYPQQFCLNKTFCIWPSKRKNTIHEFSSYSWHTGHRFAYLETPHFKGVNFC